MILSFFISLVCLNYILISLSKQTPARRLFLIGISPAAFYFYPYIKNGIKKLYFFYSSKREERKIKKEIVFLMSSVKSYLQAGLLLEQSFNMTLKQRSWCLPINLILKKILGGFRHGKSFLESLELGSSGCAKKHAYQHLHMFFSALCLAQKTGGNTVLLVERIQTKITDHLYLAQKIRALTAQIRLQAGVIFISPWVLALIIYCLSPSYILFFVTEPLGLVLLVLMLILNILAFLSLSFILRIQ